MDHGVLHKRSYTFRCVYTDMKLYCLAQRVAYKQLLAQSRYTAGVQHATCCCATTTSTELLQY